MIAEVVQRADAKIQAFVSQATYFLLKPHSDLDPLIFKHDKLPLLLLGDLRVAVAEFNLPYSVNIIEAWDATSGSLAILNEVAIIELRLSSAII